MEDPDLGPLMNEKAVAKQEEHVADALARGARCSPAASAPASGRSSSSRPCSPTCRPTR
jgi:aspartate-semialdehyde dehydrogenase